MDKDIKKTLESFKSFGPVFRDALFEFRDGGSWESLVESDRFKNFIKEQMSERYNSSITAYVNFDKVYDSIVGDDYWYQYDMDYYIDQYGRERLFDLMRTTPDGPIHRKVMEKLDPSGPFEGGSGVFGTAVGAGVGAGLGSVIGGTGGAIGGAVLGGIIGSKAHGEKLVPLNL